ncbi:MAG: dihydroorotate dehydrogenase electron transfer subunit [Chthonomonadales bacterium]
MRYQLEAPILAHDQLAEFEYELTLDAPQIAAEAHPGQFVQVLYDQTYRPFTRRPFSIYKPNPERGTFSIVYLARGVFTQGLRRKRAGEKLSIVGPLGNWFEADPRPECTHVLVAGGVGAPPLQVLAARICRMVPTVVINGARTASLLVAGREFAAMPLDYIPVTEDGSAGRRGVVTDILSELLQAPGRPIHVYACGPTAMLRAVSALCARQGVPCRVSVETMMPCGLGVCMGCVVRIRDAGAPGFRYARSCFEGPVFDASQILWDDVSGGA